MNSDDILDMFQDSWLVSARANQLFFISTWLVLAETLMFALLIAKGERVEELTFPLRLGISIVGMAGVAGMFFVWLGMWRFWVRFDRSGKWSRRAWFILLLVGFWWSSCVYYYVVYRRESSA